MSNIHIDSRQQIKALRALEALMDGGVLPVLVPACECRFGPTVPIGAGFGGVPHSDGAAFSDGSLYASDPYGSTAQAAPLRAVRITLNNGFGQYIEGGEAFSIEHLTEGDRRYIIVGVDGDEITIRPPLREAIEDETRIEFKKPACIMRLVNADSFFDAINMGRFSEANPVFHEAFEP